MPKKGKKGKKDAPPPFKGVARRLRALLTARETTIPEMTAELDVTEAAVLDGLRRLGKSRKGTLRSGMVDGRPCWWWEETPPQPAAAPPAAPPAGKK